MRTRLLGVCCVLALVGCTRDNPAFNDGDTESPPETGAESATIETTDTAETGEGTSEEGPTDPPPCAPKIGLGGSIQVVLPCNTNDVGVYDRWFRIVEVEGSTWGVESCAANCGDCEPVVSDLVFDPVELGVLAPLMTCIHVKARRLPTSNVDSCEYHTAVVEADIGGNPAPFLLARTAQGLDLPPVAGGPELGGLSPIPAVVETCPCDSAPEACCDGDVTTAPTTYAWNIGLNEPVYIGTKAGIMLDGHPYEFWNLDASFEGGCEGEHRVTWAAYRPL